MSPPSNGHATTTTTTTTSADQANVKFSLQTSGNQATSQQFVPVGSSPPPRSSNGHGASNGGGGGAPKNGVFLPVPKQPIRRLTDSRCDQDELSGRTNLKKIKRTNFFKSHISHDYFFIKQFKFVGHWCQSVDKLSFYSKPFISQHFFNISLPFAGLQHMQQCQVRISNRFLTKLMEQIK